MGGPTEMLVPILPWISAFLAGAWGFGVASRLERRRGVWALASFLFLVPLMVLFQLGCASATSTNTRWLVRTLGAAAIFAAAFLVGELPMKLPAVAELEASTAVAWFSDDTLLAEGSVLHAAEGALQLHGSSNRPVVLALAGIALGVFLRSRTGLWCAVLAGVGFVLGAGAQLTTVLTSVGNWLVDSSIPPEISPNAIRLAFGVLIWAAIGLSWLVAQREQRAA